MGFKRSAAAAMVAVGCSLSLIACGSSSTGSGGNGHTVTAKFAHLQSANTPTNQSAEQFAKLVAQYTSNKVQIKVYPNGELGSPTAALQGLQGGTIQFYATPDLSEVEPATDAIELPYLYPSVQVASKVLNGPVVRRDLWDKFSAHGMKVLGVWSIGYTDIYTVSKPVNSVSDLSGQRIRIFDPGVGVPAFKALGADAVNVPSTQVVTALATHTIDGADDPPSTMFGSKWTSTGGYLAVTNDTFVPSPVLVSQKFWDTLTSSEQAAVSRAFKQTLAVNLQEAQSSSASSVKQLKASGIKLTYPNSGAFRSALAPVYHEIQAKYGRIVPDLQTAIKQGG